MKYLLMILTSLLQAYSCSACEGICWENHWVNALESIDLNDIEQAECDIKHCLDALGAKGADGYRYIYIQRAYIYIEQKRYDEAMRDLNAVLSDDTISMKDRGRALLLRSSIYARTDRAEEYIQDIEDWKAIVLPSFRWSENRIFIRNIPYDCYMKGVMERCFHSIDDQAEIKMHGEEWIVEMSRCGC